jgi:hypothetical protein
MRYCTLRSIVEQVEDRHLSRRRGTPPASLRGPSAHPHTTNLLNLTHTTRSFPRKRESSAPKPVTRPWIPASAGMTATERSENPNAIAPGFREVPRTPLQARPGSPVPARFLIPEIVAMMAKFACSGTLGSPIRLQRRQNQYRCRGGQGLAID